MRPELEVLPVREGFPQALGSGSELAIGAMAAAAFVHGLMAEDGLDARRLVELAVRVAMKRDAGTGGKMMLALRGADYSGPEWIE